MEAEITLYVDCQGNFRKGLPAYFDHGLGVDMPADPDMIEDFRVIFEGLDITHKIDKQLKQKLYEEMLQEERDTERMRE